MSDALQVLLDKQAITEQLYRYCRAVDRLDIALGHSVFHEDAVADYGEHSYRGPARGVIDYICDSHRKLQAHSHQVTNVLIEVDGDRAASEAYVFAALRGDRADRTVQLEIWARYCDTWSRREGRWAIDRRESVIDFDAMGDVRPIHGPAQADARSRRDRQDPTYAILKGQP